MMLTHVSWGEHGEKTWSARQLVYSVAPTGEV